MALKSDKNKKQTNKRTCISLILGIDFDGVLNIVDTGREACHKRFMSISFPDNGKLSIPKTEREREMANFP